MVTVVWFRLCRQPYACQWYPPQTPNCTFQVQTSPQSSRPSYLRACLLSSSAVWAQSPAQHIRHWIHHLRPHTCHHKPGPKWSAPQWMAPAAHVTASVWSLASASPPPVSTRQQLLPVSPPKYLLNQPTSRYCHPPPVVSESLTCHLIGLPESAVASQADLFPNKWPFPFPGNPSFVLHILNSVSSVSSKNGSNTFSNVMIWLMTVDSTKCELQDGRDKSVFAHHCMQEPRAVSLALTYFWVNLKLMATYFHGESKVWIQALLQTLGECGSMVG